MDFRTLVVQMGQNLDLQARVVNVGPLEYNKKGTPLQKVTLTDLQGATSKATIYQGNNPPMSSAQTGQTLAFKLKADSFQGRTYFSGFWQCPRPQEEPDYGQDDFLPASRPQTRQVAPQAPIPPRSVPNYPPARNQAPQADWAKQERDKSASICRQCAGKCAAEIMNNITMTDWTPNQVLAYLSQLIEPMAAYFLTGDWRLAPADEPEQDDSSPDFQE